MKETYLSPEVEVLPMQPEAAILQISPTGENMNPVHE